MHSPRARGSTRAVRQIERYILTSGSASIEDACPKLSSRQGNRKSKAGNRRAIHETAKAPASLSYPGQGRSCLRAGIRYPLDDGHKSEHPRFQEDRPISRNAGNHALGVRYQSFRRPEAVAPLARTQARRPVRAIILEARYWAFFGRQPRAGLAGVTEKPALIWHTTPND